MRQPYLQVLDPQQDDASPYPQRPKPQGQEVQVFHYQLLQHQIQRNAGLLVGEVPDTTGLLDIAVCKPASVEVKHAFNNGQDVTHNHPGNKGALRTERVDEN